MAEVTLEAQPVPPWAVKSIEEIAAADIIIGILADLSQNEMAQVCTDLGTLTGNPRIVVLQKHPTASAAQVGDSEPKVQPEGASSENSSASLWVVPWNLQEPEMPSPLATFATACSSLFAAGEKLGVRGCCVVVSNLEYAPPKWVCRLAEPLLDNSFDFVAPRYAVRKFEGLLNNSIIARLTRSLYGRRLQSPMGPDFGVSLSLVQDLSNGNSRNRDGIDGGNLLASLAPRTACENLRVCQTYLGARRNPPADSAAVSSLLSQVLGPVFSNMETNAACWQRVRNSTPVRTLNQTQAIPQQPRTVEVGHSVNSFQQGVRDLQDIWGLVLPPATLLELRKLSRAAAEQHHFPDELWVRIIYDFALAHRLRAINREHLLHSFTPLYLGWLASYARQVEGAGPAAVEERFERLAGVYEAEKPYLVSRWRWPDRFNP